jgi:hypothetical protein
LKLLARTVRIGTLTVLHMRRPTIIGVAVLAALLPLTAEAQFGVGARLGYAMPFGDAVKDGRLSDVLGGAFPFQLDLGYAVHPDVTVGAFFSYAFGRLGEDAADECSAFGLDCSARVIRAGVRGQLSFWAESPAFAPWAGLGVAYEWASLSQSGGGVDRSLGYRGFEFVELELGADYRPNARVRVGPFVSGSLGQYQSATVEVGGSSDSGAIPGKGLHLHLTFGVRGQFEL